MSISVTIGHGGDPTKVWIDYLMRHGGYATLLGIPAAIATLTFVSRVLWLKNNCTPHNYGRTGWIYWPTQLMIALGALIALYIASSPYSFNGLSLGALFMSVACAAGLKVNQQEHRYKIRSSDYLFVYYLVTIITSLLSLFILHQDGTAAPTDTAIQNLGAFTFVIALAFVIEALPRHNTKVQIASRQQEHLTPYQQANLWSRWTFHYAQDIISIGYVRPLRPEDVDDTAPAALKTDVNFERVSASWEKELAHSKKPSMFKAVFKSYQGRIFFLLLGRMLGAFLYFMPPAIFGKLLGFFVDYHNAIREGTEPPSIQYGLLIALGILVSNVVSTLMIAGSSQGLFELGFQARAATVAMIYRKSLKLSPQARQKSTVGEITNHMAVDAEKWNMAANMMPLLLVIPTELVVGCILLYRILGWSLFAGFAVFFIITPIQGKFSGFISVYEEDKMERMDARVRMMSEVLSNIKIIKLYGWEDAFRKKIDGLRGFEIKAEKSLATVRSCLGIFFSSITLLMALATFSVYSTIGGPNFTPGRMTPEVIFVSMGLFGMLNKPLGLASMAISMTIVVKIGIKRIESFLVQEEIDTTVVQRFSCQQNVKGRKAMAIEIEDGTFAWEKEEPVSAATSNADTTDLSPNDAERQPLLPGSTVTRTAPAPFKPVLSNINLDIAAGSLTAVVGRIGQGKSSLLSAIMGEMYKKQGTVKVYGDFAYVPQQAWICNATVKDNILFGKSFDQDLYDRIVTASGLRPDLEMLSAGDQTEIGERGINLSGGQKQRISLARAAYQDADVYLLDDPLSAVDAHVDQHLWQHLIGPQGLLKDKTRVLVTHGIHHLDHVDQIVVLKDGAVSETGAYQQLIDARGAFYQLIKDFSVTKKNKKSKHQRDSTAVEATVEEGDVDSERNTIVEEENGDDDNKGDDVKGNNGELVADEAMEEGKVGWKIAHAYVKAVVAHTGTPFSLSHCSLLRWDSTFSRTCGCAIGSATRRKKNTAAPQPKILFYVILDVFLNYTGQVVCGIQAARTLHDALLTRILRLPMSFFDTTPLGRIVNRFSSDIGAIDSQLPENNHDMIGFIFHITGTLLIIGYATPAFLIAVPPLAFFFFLVQDYYIRSANSLRRLISISKSPLYQHFSESISGVTTIRVMKGLTQQFVDQNEVHSDLITVRQNIFSVINRWLQIRVEVLGGIVNFAAAALAVLYVDKLDPSMVGLALSYALSIVGYINYFVRTICETQNLLISVERVLEYSHKPTEAPVKTGVQLPENWPQQGRVVFKNYSTRYREGLDLVIKNVSFSVDPAEKVGIVGRTGAGKSSLTLALFRIIEAADSFWARASDPSSASSVDKNKLQGHGSDEPFEPSRMLGLGRSGGSIEIDGIDISTLGLNDLRRHLAIIPQDPTLFAGTIRDNLDPFQELSDAELWQALERAHLKHHIASLTGGLSFEVAQNGDNFSVGQRSLICLARALLRKTKVLVLDEATAAVDVETDDLIQKTIRKEFADRTILTIAHRIKTVMDSDKILVLEKGKVEEFEEPGELLRREEGSLFRGLAEQAGEI
ncbi:hypothetical protein BGZ95_001422 [Linnemannia exigua]|uniref:P-loop containing nucleoside triphosphate hydrolase protein n=1 Tax=Linnemannia exigua TaxID=604196 RepID=A0AAD4H2R4_9FUNG|nr:hypothetical protein BGZ95_001422 [Linnemannia exigua]